MVTKTFTALIHREEDIYVAECPEVDTVSQGYNVEEAVANLKEATELYLEDFSSSLEMPTGFIYTLTYENQSQHRPPFEY